MCINSEEAAMVQDLCDGLTYKAIGNKLNMSLWAVERRLKHVWGKLGAETPEEGIVAAVSRGFAKYTQEINYKCLEYLGNYNTLIQLVAQGMSNKQIANCQRTSEGYVRKMLSQVYKAANVSGRHQLAALYAAVQIEP